MMQLSDISFCKCADNISHGSHVGMAHFVKVKVESSNIGPPNTSMT